MKKLILLLMMFVSILSFSEKINIQNIAVVDTQMVLQQYNKRITLEANMDTKKEEADTKLNLIKEEILTAELELIKSKDKKSNLSKTKLSELKQSLEVAYNEADVELQKLHGEYNEVLNLDISTAVHVVGRELGFDMVFHKNTTFYGGTDISRDVIDFLNSGTKLSLNLNEVETLNNDLN